MNNQPLEDDGMPSEIDFREGVRGLHHVLPRRGFYARFDRTERAGVFLIESPAEGR